MGGIPTPEAARAVANHRPCTCHPDERPRPCAKRYALGDCLAEANAPETLRAELLRARSAYRLQPSQRNAEWCERVWGDLWAMGISA
jgi:hypothetical protein